jgi:hypothetical protein
MKKQDERSPEEIAKDLEDIDFAEIDEDELKEAFGGTTGLSEREQDINVNCCC